MEDIELAGSLLHDEKWNLAIVRGGKVLFRSRERGVAPFFLAIQAMDEGLHGAALADRIVGAAVAMLCLHAGIVSVYADIASLGAVDILEGRGVVVRSNNVVPHISNYDGTDLCPFEKLAQNSENPSRLVSALQAIFGGSDNDGGKTYP